ncbi:MAG: helix-turn-helix transcriptional regulator [Sedimentisphaerales bacterium]|nr:helix-turn-helix transcriptional regulator [Sedimentisphaerales bacterium]MBN2843736.1 helix-turn-helix transcriptional regulator [Sedimentisphaerales bacterium]
MAMKISTTELPCIDRIGEFSLCNPVFDFTYRNPTNILHLYNYSGLVRINSREYQFAPGDITCIQGGSVYSYSSAEPGKHWCVHFYDMPTGTDKGIEIPEFIPLGINSLFLAEQIKHISTLFNTMGTNTNTVLMNLEARYRLKALLLSVSILLTGQKRGSRSKGSFTWDKILNWIDDNLSEPISTAELAKMANLTANTFSQKFKKQYNVTISQYILRKRIDKARSLLTTTTLTIYEVGAAVGIADPQYFNKQFHKVTGVSPSRYRDENQDYLSQVASDLATKGGFWS